MDTIDFSMIRHEEGRASDATIQSLAIFDDYNKNMNYYHNQQQQRQ
jgi:hypothetical protein